MRRLINVGLLVAISAVLVLSFPQAYGFVQMAARELRYLWWLVLLVALGIWLIWGIGRSKRKD